MTQAKNEVKKAASKPAANFGRNRRAGHHRHTTDHPKAAGTTSGIAYSSEFGTKTASKDDDGTKQGLAKERGRQRKGDQQSATRKFTAGEHPTAHLDKHINVSPTAGTPYFMNKFDLGIGAGQHATA